MSDPDSIASDARESLWDDVKTVEHWHDCPVCEKHWFCDDSPCAGRFRMCSPCKLNEEEDL